MPQPHPATLALGFLALTALIAGGCTHTRAYRSGPPAWRSVHAGYGGGADIGPLTDAQGRRRSLALAPAQAYSESGPYASRNDQVRSVSAGFRSPSIQTAETRTIDRGPGTTNGRLTRGRSLRLRDGITTRTIRRSQFEVVQ